MDGLINRKVWKAVKRSSLTPEDHIFATRFHYKIKRKNGAFERCKVRLVVQGQHMQKKDASGSGDFQVQSSVYIVLRLIALGVCFIATQT